MPATSELAGLMQHCLCVRVLGNYKNSGCSTKGCFSGCIRFGSMNCEVTQDAIQQHQQPENGVSVSRLSCCFALVHIWCCMCCATAVQTDIFWILRMSATLHYLSSPVSMFHCPHSKFKNVCKHMSTHQEIGTSAP